MNATAKPEGFVGVHIGAGQHSEARTALYLDICSAACQAAIQVLREGGSALDAAEKATIVLEDAGETNAGYGSNLTESGTLEMDAGLMDGSNLLFGAVGAITEVKNPIRVARKLVDEQARGLLPLGRVPPGFLVGEGARDWAIRHGIHTVTSDKLVSEKAVKLYKHYKKKLDAYKLSLEQNKRKKEEDESLESVVCKKFRMSHKISITEQVRSSDGASKMVDGSSLDLEENSQATIANRGMVIRPEYLHSHCLPSSSLSNPPDSYRSSIPTLPSRPLSSIPNLSSRPTSSQPNLSSRPRSSLPSIPSTSSGTAKASNLHPTHPSSIHSLPTAPLLNLPPPQPFHLLPKLSPQHASHLNNRASSQQASHLNSRAPSQLTSTATQHMVRSSQYHQHPTLHNQSQGPYLLNPVVLPDSERIPSISLPNQAPQIPADINSIQIKQQDTTTTIPSANHCHNNTTTAQLTTTNKFTSLNNPTLTNIIKPGLSFDSTKLNNSQINHHTMNSNISLHQSQPVNLPGFCGSGDSTQVKETAVSSATYTLPNKNVYLDGTVDNDHDYQNDNDQDDKNDLNVNSDDSLNDSDGENYNDHECESETVNENDNNDVKDDNTAKDNEDDSRPDCDDQVHDTVGVVILDSEGNVAASVSSGGIALKQSGRVGQASCYGCGCWAQRQIKNTKSSVAVSTTGCGEHLVRTLIAKECGQGLANSNNPMESLQTIMKEKFAESEFLEGISEKLGGAICMQFTKSSGLGSFLWTHTTSSMGIGFQSTGDSSATVKMSRLPKPSNVQGTTILVESVNFSTRS